MMEVERGHPEWNTLETEYPKHGVNSTSTSERSERISEFIGPPTHGALSPPSHAGSVLARHHRQPDAVLVQWSSRGARFGGAGK